MRFAVAVTEAWPLASVIADAAVNVADAPAPGAAKVTVTPLTGLPEASLTVATSGWETAVAMAALGGGPPVAWIFAAVPAVILKGLLVAEVKPLALACNV